MPTTTEPSEHLSIGEVLATLRDEFPDITISKIRFLESQGLIDPERTPSGYRKFYGPDIDRLRWILHQQKENFLPLKVIKGRLEDAGPDELPADVAEAPPEPEQKPEKAAAKASPSKSGSRSTPTRSKTTDQGGPDSPKPASRRSKAKPAAKKVKKPSEDTPTLALDDGTDDDLDARESDGTMTRAELAKASGLTDAQITELEEFGLLEPAGTGGDRMQFDDDALVIATLAAGFAKHGIGARHLRMYRTFAEREATLYGQVIQGVLRQRNPEARARARADVVELAGMGRTLRSTFLRRSVDELLTD
jgi:DNA-binding transcriptional MerR regulator